MKVNIAQLRRTEGGSERFVFSERVPSLQLGRDEYIFKSPLNVRITAVNTGKSLLIKGTVDLEIMVSCSRCLKEFPFRLEFELEDEWLPEEFAELNEEENAFIVAKDEFDITERILEHVLLHIPMKFMCSEDCKGLCPQCGADLNTNPCSCADEVIDPRLEILSKWNKGV